MGTRAGTVNPPHNAKVTCPAQRTTRRRRRRGCSRSRAGSCSRPAPAPCPRSTAEALAAVLGVAALLALGALLHQKDLGAGRAIAHYHDVVTRRPRWGPCSAPRRRRPVPRWRPTHSGPFLPKPLQRTRDELPEKTWHTSKRLRPARPAAPTGRLPLAGLPVGADPTAWAG